jgi:enoyl-[acyl-carrier protein] reductase I
MNIPVFPETKVALKGKKGLIVGIANDQSIAWGCAKAFRALGAELAVTYLNDRAKRFVEPLAKVLEAPIFMPLDVNVEGETEKVFERIEKEWGKLDSLLHSIRCMAALSMSVATDSSRLWRCPAGHSCEWPILPNR